MQKIVGYHGTKGKFADSIIKEGFKIPEKKENDNHWLGHGIYFYEDYKLAEWWGKTKVNRHNEKYNLTDTHIVIKGVIEGEKVWDLDDPHTLERFYKCQEKLEKEFISSGVILNFSKGDTKEKIRCFWMDSVKVAKEVSVIMYTFTRTNPSYVESKFHVNNKNKPSRNIGLEYHEKQICVTKNDFIVERSIASGQNIEWFDEVII